MGPPPAPGAQSQPTQDTKAGLDDPLSQKILGPEVKAMKERLIVRFLTDSLPRNL